MKVSLVTLLAALMAFTALALYAGTRKSGRSMEKREVFALMSLLIAVLSLFSGIPFSDGCGLVTIVSILPSLACMAFLTSSLYDSVMAGRWAVAAMTFNVAVVIFHVVNIIMGVTDVPPAFYLIAICLVLVLQSAFYMLGLWSRVKKVKEVMKTGTVWANVGLGIDGLYMFLEMMFLVIYLGVSPMVRTYDGLHGAVLVLFLGLETIAYANRIRTDSVFVLWRKQEQRIIEAMKVTHVESASDVSRIDEVYKEIYERVVAYFEREKPFLDCELTINDLVKVLYSNKLYISRAISQFTGRNFCQFVNYYRIKYSIECFKANHDLKIHEMASMSGFNSIVSFNMAFRLYMGENPSDWCRKEKGRHIKGEK